MPRKNEEARLVQADKTGQATPIKATTPTRNNYTFMDMIATPKELTIDQLTSQENQNSVIRQKQGDDIKIQADNTAAHPGDQDYWQMNKKGAHQQSNRSKNSAVFNRDLQGHASEMNANF